jgi:hypothetical protein
MVHASITIAIVVRDAGSMLALCTDARNVRKHALST